MIDLEKTVLRCVNRGRVTFITIQPQPGDFCVVQTDTRLTVLIETAEALSGGGYTEFDHAVICSRVDSNGNVWVVEAMPSGAEENSWHYASHVHLWSTGRVQTTSAAATAALKYVGTPYSWLDYLAIAVHRWHIPFPGLKNFVADSRRMICSQLVDRAECDAGVHLFSDGRWPGYVRPSDLADLILTSGA